MRTSQLTCAEAAKDTSSVKPLLFDQCRPADAEVMKRIQSCTLVGSKGLYVCVPWIISWRVSVAEAFNVPPDAVMRPVNWKLPAVATGFRVTLTVNPGVAQLLPILAD